MTRLQTVSSTTLAIRLATGPRACRTDTDRAAVVDDTLKVHGVPGLRVVDASIMPTPVSGNTNAAVIVIGEKGADLILADAV